MKKEWIVLFAGVVVLTSVLLTGYHPVSAAPPTGEVKTVAPGFGNQIPIPYLEMSHAVDWMELLYDPLVGYTPKGELSPDFGLANKWTISPDGLTWTFYLRKGVKFHDGVELTAKDVKFSIELLMLPDATAGEAPLVRQNVKSVDVKNPYTVVVNLKQPDIFLHTLLSNLDSSTGSMVVPKDYYESLGKDEFAKRPIGSGPYKWHSQQVGSFIKLEATDRHWRDGVPKYKYMTYLIIPEESTRLAMLRTGEADIALMSRDSVKEALSADLNVISKNSGIALAFSPGMQWTSPAFSDIRFRKALNLAIDKEAIIKQLFAGLAKPLATWPGSPISAVGGDPTLKPYPYDPQEAKRLIKEGEWEGYEFTLMNCPRPVCPELTLVVEAIAGYWRAIGLKPKIGITEWVVFREQWRGRKIQNIVFPNILFILPNAAQILPSFEERFYFKHARSTVNIPELTERYDRIKKSLNIDEISRLMAEIYRYSYDHYLMIPICEFDNWLATTKRIPKWDPGTRVDRNYYDLIKQR